MTKTKIAKPKATIRKATAHVEAKRSAKREVEIEANKIFAKVKADREKNSAKADPIATVVARAKTREAQEAAEAAKLPSKILAKAKAFRAEKAAKKPDDGLPAFLRRETAKNAPALTAAAPQSKILSPREAMAKQAQSKPATAPEGAAAKLMALLKGSTAAKLKVQERAANVVAMPKAPVFAPGTQLTARDVKVGMRIRIRDKNGRVGGPVYIVMEKEADEPLCNDPNFVAYNEDYLAHISDVVAA